MSMGNRNSRLKKALEGKEISQEKLAERLGITRAAVNERLNKDADIDSIAFINAVAELTGYDKDWLINGEGEPKVANDSGQDLIKILADQSRTQTEYIDMLKSKINMLEEELAKYNKGKSGSTTP